MLQDWIHWMSSLQHEELFLILFGILFIDGPRYCYLKVMFCLWDMTQDSLRWLLCREVSHSPMDRDQPLTHCPSVCVVLAGYNEQDTIEATLASVWGAYPRMEIIVVDDGSLDEMQAVARRFRRKHLTHTAGSFQEPDLRVLRKSERGGKSSCINYALNFTRAEIIIVVDTDSDLAPDAIWRIVQPFSDPLVGCVSAAVLARNPFTNLITWLQANEYLHAIFTGRIVSSRLGVLAVCSGAFGAFRREAVERAMGWDVGPGEDGDLTIRIRKAGYKVAYAPYASCYTNLPKTWKAFFRQRRRWNRGAIRYKSRKHVDMANLLSPNFRLSNFLVLANIWFFNIACLLCFWAYAIYIVFAFSIETWFILMMVYFAYLTTHAVETAVVLYYSQHRLRDFKICSVLPLMPVFQLVRKTARIISIAEECFFRRSFQDNYVPPRVRAATWHW